MNKLDRINKGTFWRMDHPDGCAAKFTVTVCGARDKNPNNVQMQLTVHGPHAKVCNHVVNNPISATLAHMRDEWNRLAQRGFVYNAD